MRKIIFYQERTFGEKFNVSFEFIKQNWKILLRYISYGILPLSLVGGLSFDGLIMNITDEVALYDVNNTYSNFVLPYISLVIIFMVGALWLATTVFSLMRVYNQRDNGLENITFSEVKDEFKRNAWRIVKCNVLITLLMLAVISVFVLLAMLIHWSVMFLLIAAVVASFIPLLMITPTYLYEDISIWKACVRGFQLGWKTWGGIFALGVVLWLLSNVIVSIFSLPWEICFIVKSIFAQSGSADSSFLSSVWFTLISYVFSIVMFYVQYVAYSLFYVSTSYLYSHAAEQQDDMSVEAGIANFNELADNNKDAEEEDIWS